MKISRDQINDAVARFKDRGGSIKRFDRVIGEPIFGNEFLLTEDTLELIETKESDFLV